MYNILHIKVVISLIEELPSVYGERSIIAILIYDGHASWVEKFKVECLYFSEFIPSIFGDSNLVVHGVPANTETSMMTSSARCLLGTSHD
jgi:hypothetical protein